VENIHNIHIRESERKVAIKIEFWYFSINITNFFMATNPLEEPVQDEEVNIQEPAKVILFNDDVHTFDEVIGQLIKAIKCTKSKAEALAWEVHSSGKAIVYAGEMIKCVEVSSVLEEIALMTQIEV
jgi:ATP-dependent Clp protease adaptor protein ClpS